MESRTQNEPQNAPGRRHCREKERMKPSALHDVGAEPPKERHRGSGP